MVILPKTCVLVSLGSLHFVRIKFAQKSKMSGVDSLNTVADTSAHSYLPHWRAWTEGAVCRPHRQTLHPPPPFPVRSCGWVACHLQLLVLFSAGSGVAASSFLLPPAKFKATQQQGIKSQWGTFKSGVRMATTTKIKRLKMEVHQGLDIWKGDFKLYSFNENGTS